MEAVIYARQSLDRDGRGAAVDRQLSACRTLAEGLGLTIRREYVDNDTSATKGQRPAFSELLDDIAAGNVAHLIAWHTDRLYRMKRDITDIIELAGENPLTIHTARAGTLDLSSPAGRMIANLMADVARYEVEQKGARQVASNLQRAQQGHWQFSNRPYGYERVGGDVRIVEAEAEIVREAFDRYLGGESYYAIALDLNRRKIPTVSGAAWTTTQLRDRLKNPAYAGILLYKGDEIGEGAWEPIISRDVWERFNAVRSRRKVRHDWSNKTKYLLSGIARCGVCGARMLARPEYGRKPVDGVKPRRMTYQCTTGWCVSRGLELVDQVVEDAIVERLSDPNVLELLGTRTDVAPLVAESQMLRERHEQLAELLADGTLPVAAVREQSALLSARRDELERQIGAAEGGSQVTALALADDVAAHWRNVLTLQQKRSVIQAGLVVTVNRQANTRRFNRDDVVVQWKGE